MAGWGTKRNLLFVENICNVFLFRYVLNGNDASAFSIDNKTGELRAAHSFDREKQGQYLLELRAIDHGQDVQLSGTTQIVVNIVDMNDNKPEFTNLPPTLHVPNNVKRG